MKFKVGDEVYLKESSEYADAGKVGQLPLGVKGTVDAVDTLGILVSWGEDWGCNYKEEDLELVVDCTSTLKFEITPSDVEWTDEHYNFDYKLTPEDIEKGSVRIDAYFVNRMWNINQADDTGAAFHLLKTLTRLSNNKNPLERELTAIVEQAKILAKLHNVELKEEK